MVPLLSKTVVGDELNTNIPKIVETIEKYGQTKYYVSRRPYLALHLKLDSIEEIQDM